MSIRNAILTVGVSALLLACLGTTIGLLLGKFVPNYYRSIVIRGADPRFSPIAFGVGQGLTQGVAGGIVVGLVLVAILTWRDIRLTQVSNGIANFSETSHSSPRSSRLLSVVLSLLLAATSGFTGCIAGSFGSERRAYHRRFHEEKEALESLLDGDTAFSNVTIHERSDGGIYLLGSVPTPSDLDRLRGLTERAVGLRSAERASGGVESRDDASDH